MREITVVPDTEAIWSAAERWAGMHANPAVNWVAELRVKASKIDVARSGLSRFEFPDGSAILMSPDGKVGYGYNRIRVTRHPRVSKFAIARTPEDRRLPMP